MVIAILALLVSVLLPTLATARSRSKEASCLARIRTIATGAHTYAADDPTENLIPVHPRLFEQDFSNPTFIGAYEWGGKSGIGDPGFTDGPASGEYAWISSKYGTQAGFGPNTRPMNDVLYPGSFRDNRRPRFDRDGAHTDTQLPLDVYHCPADNGPPRGAHAKEWVAHSERSSFDHFGNSYAANLHWVGGPGQILYSYSPFLLPNSRIPNSTRSLLFEENIGRWAWICKRGGPSPWTERVAIDPGPTKIVLGWHGRDWTFNRAFVDGHAGAQRIIIEGTEDENGYSYHHRNEVDFESTIDGMRDVGSSLFSIRGDGWQKDVFPAHAAARLPGLNEMTNLNPWTEGTVVPARD